MTLLQLPLRNSIEMVRRHAQRHVASSNVPAYRPVRHVHRIDTLPRGCAVPRAIHVALLYGNSLVLF